MLYVGAGTRHFHADHPSDILGWLRLHDARLWADQITEANRFVLACNTYVLKMLRSSVHDGMATCMCVCMYAPLCRISSLWAKKGTKVRSQKRHAQLLVHHDTPPVARQSVSTAGSCSYLTRARGLSSPPWRPFFLLPPLRPNRLPCRLPLAPVGPSQELRS
eukprot:COSAG01_NODE_2889_length_6907_cov_43.104877_3_plen_162_part_00